MSGKRLWIAAAVLAAADCLGAQSIGEWFRDCDACPEMVVLPAGSFLMGSPESEEGRDDDEGPQHRVTIREAFAVGVDEVKFEEWKACVTESACPDSGNKREEAGNSVSGVSWEDAQAYVRWLSGETGREYRLLSEAEWEYASRDAQAYEKWLNGETGREHQLLSETEWEYASRGGYGLINMIGNVWEWVQDCWNGSYEGAPNNGSAWERGDCSRRVLRGGSWFNYSRDLRSANHLSYRSGYRNFLDCGFRVARTLTP